MFYKILSLIICLCVSVLSFSSIAAKNEHMTYIYNAPESTLDVRYNYQWEILRTALEKTQSEYGKFVLIPSIPMSEKGQIHELKKNSGALTVMYLDTSPDLEKSLTPIRIPVDKNLVGYRVFLIHKNNKDILKNTKTLDDLKKFTFGLGFGWIDIDIYKANGLEVISGSTYELLFEMLRQKRFDLFSRGVTEIFEEYNAHRTTHPELEIEENVLMFCPQPMYFWFAKTPEGAKLAERAEKGMRIMMRDGTYDKIFVKHFKKDIDFLKLNKRTLITLINPFLVKETPLDKKELWFDPLKSY